MFADSPCNHSHGEQITPLPPATYHPDVNPYLALAAIIGCGMYGVEHQLPLPMGEAAVGEASGDPVQQRLPTSLQDAVGLGG